MPHGNPLVGRANRHSGALGGSRPLKDACKRRPKRGVSLLSGGLTGRDGHASPYRRHPPSPAFLGIILRIAAVPLGQPLSQSCHQCVISPAKSFGPEEESMSEVDGATLMARSLKQQGIDHLFGVVGFPVGPIAAAAQKEGVAYIGMRNEQTASYAAQAYGYMTGRPGACITVTGPGVVHGLAGLANAQQNCWPMILIGGASETYRGGMGAFQEERQVLIASPFCKFAHGIESVARIPYYVEMATRHAINGRPGGTYLDVPDDIITGKCDTDKVVEVQRAPEPPRMVAPMENIEAALSLLERAERPLVLIGKGM